MTLIDKLAALTGPDREAEEAIYEALGNCNHKRYECYRVQGDSGQTCLDCGKDLYGADHAPRYTASIDAAMTLVPEGAQWSLEADAAWVRILTADDVAEYQGVLIGRDGKCTAIALCIAALKARDLT